MAERAWCPVCERSQDIEDQFIDDTGDSRVTVTEYVVTHLSCGHSTEHTTREYRSPLQQAGPTPSTFARDPFLGEG